MSLVRIVAALLVILSPAVAAAQEEAAEIPADSQSVGYADEGHLEHPFAIESGDRLVVVKRHRYGTRELVGLLHRAADHVSRTAPGALLAVGDLSSEEGGPLAPHGSHQSGRDADLGFYMVDAETGRPMPRGMFMDVAPDGRTVRAGRRYMFDDARNWALLAAFVDDPMAEVQHVLIVEHLRERLLDYARRIEAPEDQIRRVELVTRHIRGSENHDDHFHVRIYCSIGDRPHCLDKPPLHPWYYGTPSPDAVEAARIADMQRAAALRRAQQQERRAHAQLLRGQALAEAQVEAMARALVQETSRQQRAEQQRAARLTRQETHALRELARQERELRLEEAAQRAAERGRSRSLHREDAEQEAEERGRARQLEAEEQRWVEAERQRARQLRAHAQRFAERERRRAAELRNAERAARALLRRAERQQAADRRRARQLLERSERLMRERARQ